VEAIADYVHNQHRAPVGNGQVFGDLGSWVGKLRNRIHTTPSCDVAWINWYGDDLADKVDWLRACQAYTGRPCYVEQYAPWDARRDAPYTPEPEDLSRSKAHEWAAVCGEYGAVGPMRWPEIRPIGERAAWWGVAHPKMAEIGGVTAQFAGDVDPDSWDERGEAWEARIEARELELAAAWGDGRHVTFYGEWPDDTPRAVQVGGMQAGDYDVRLYDWQTGELQASQCCAGDRLLFAVRPLQGRAVVLVSPSKPAPTGLTLSIEGETALTGVELRLVEGDVYQVRVS
jgi:hypothetical protein